MNKRGFTLIEVLSVLVLIAIISGIAIIGTSSFFKTAEERYYDTLESNILLAGNDYFTDHRDELPTENNFSEVSLENLVADKYMEPVKDSNGNICTTGMVYAYREKNKYKYEVCLKCGEYASPGKDCEERVSRDIVVSAKLHGTNTPYDVLKSYNRVSYSDGKDVDVTLAMDNKYIVSMYGIYNTRNNLTNSCSDLTNNNTCTYIITDSGSYKITAYDEEGNELSTKYINVRIAKNGSGFTLEGDSKYTITKNECNSNNNTKLVTIELVKGSQDEEYKSIEYRINKVNLDGTEYGSYKEANSTTIQEALESGHYVIDVIVTNYADNTSIKTKTVDVTYLVDILYEDDNSTTTHEVVAGQNYNYLSNLPITKFTYGKNLEITWYKNDVRIDSTDKVEENCTYTIIGKTAIPVDPVDFTTFCKTNLQYTGSEQTLTSGNPTNVTFINNKGTNSNTYTVSAHINEPQYVWSDGTTGDKTFSCTINPYPTTITLNPTSGTLTYGTNGTTTVTTSSKGTITCLTSDDSVATCTVSNNTITVTPKANSTDGVQATLTISQEATTNYTAASATYVVTVNRNLLTCPESPSDKTFTSSNIGSGISCPSGSTAGGTINAISAGSYTQTCISDAGYKFAGTCSIDWRINPRPVTVMAPTVVLGNLTYTGNDQNLLSNAGSCSTGGTMYWYSANPTTSNTAPTFSTSSGWTTTSPGISTYKGKNAGTYYVWYYCHVSDTVNNTGTNINAVKNVSKAIDKKSLTITANSQTINYGSSIATGTNQITSSGLVTGDSITSVSLTPSTTNYTTNGTITPSAVATTKGASNYNVSYNTGVLKINKVNSTNPTLTAYSGGYDGSSHTIGVSGGSGGTIKYSTDGSTWTTTKPTRTNEGTTTVYVKIVGDTNHNDSTAISTTIKVYNPTLSCPSTVLRGNTATASLSSNDGVNSITYTSSNTNVATISNGTISSSVTTAGSTTITASINYANNSITKTCNVAVSQGVACYYANNACSRDFATIQAAVDAAPNNTLKTIRLLSNETIASTIPSTKKISLDLNSKTINVSSGESVTVEGELTINGNGTIIASDGSNEAVSVTSTGKLTVQNGTYKGKYGIISRGTTTTVKNATLEGVSYGLSILGGNQFTIENCTASGENGLYISAENASGTVTGGTYTGTNIAGIHIGYAKGVTISNVTATGKYYGLYDIYSNNVIVNSGTYYGQIYHAVYVHGSGAAVNINGGTFKACQETFYTENTIVNSPITSICDNSYPECSTTTGTYGACGKIHSRVTINY